MRRGKKKKKRTQQQQKESGDMENITQKWIPVTERLPEKKGAFLVCTKHDFYGTQNVAKARFCDGEWHGTGGIWSNVTHWMSLPEPPKGEWGI